MLARVVSNVPRCLAPVSVGAALSQPAKVVRTSIAAVPPVSRARDVSVLKAYASHKRAEELAALHLPDVHELAAGGKKNVRKISGDEIWEDIHATINRIFPECWLEQAKIVEALVSVNVRRIYGAELELVMDRLLKDNGWDRSIFCNLLLIICPRRFGKTRATEVVAAALLLCVPGFNHVHFALQKKFGVDFVANVRTIIESTERGQQMLARTKRNKEEIVLKASTTDIRRLRSLTADSNVCSQSNALGRCLGFFFPFSPPPHPTSPLCSPRTTLPRIHNHLVGSPHVHCPQKSIGRMQIRGNKRRRMGKRMEKKNEKGDGQGLKSEKQTSSSFERSVAHRKHEKMKKKPKKGTQPTHTFVQTFLTLSSFPSFSPSLPFFCTQQFIEMSLARFFCARIQPGSSLRSGTYYSHRTSYSHRRRSNCRPCTGRSQGSSQRSPHPRSRLHPTWACLQRTCTHYTSRANPVCSCAGLCLRSAQTDALSRILNI